MSFIADLWDKSAIGKSVSETSTEISKWAKIQISLLAVTALALIVIVIQGFRNK